MATHIRYTVEYRRKREGKTNYKQRFAFIKSKTPRFTVRKTLKHISIQLIDYAPTGDKVLATAHTAELKKLGWKGPTANTPAAYLCGMLAAKKARDHNIKNCVSDIGQHTSVKGAVLYAAIKGANDNGLSVPCSNTVYPDEKRIDGTHIALWAKKLKQDNTKAYGQQFSHYLKQGVDPEKIPQHIQDLTKKLKIKGEA